MPEAPPSPFSSQTDLHEGAGRDAEKTSGSAPPDESAGRRQSEARLQLHINALNAAANAIVIANRAGVIEWANAAFTTFTGYTTEEAIGHTPGQLLRSNQHPPSFYQTMWKTIVAGRVWHGEIVNRRKDGSLYPEEMTITPVKDAEGKITQFIAVKQDISQRRALEAQFRQAQKMEAVVQLAGGISHDFNNILAAVMMHLGLLLEKSSLDDATRASLNELNKDIRRGAALTRQLLAFSRQQAMEPRRLDLRVVVAGLLKMLGRLLVENIAITLRTDQEVPEIEADAGMIEQVVMNLCINARDAMPQGGRLVLAIDAVNLSADALPEIGGVQPGRFVRLAVTDTGCGMSEDTLQHLFEPFFTTKDLGKGTGLGLATAHGIVQQHHGLITVESAVGRGTTFRIHLPVCGAGDTAVAKDNPPPPAVHRGETILLVEDEIHLRTPVAALLRHHGYVVHEASDGPSALRLWRQYREQIDLLFTDVVMPNGLDGQELVAQLRKELPRLKVIMSTGYHKNPSPKAADDRIFSLRKPYDHNELVVAVRACLDQT